jgi:carbon storage regulator
VNPATIEGELRMLVLSRKENEKIKIGPDITLVVIRVGGDRVRLGIEAPSDVVILRDELVDNQQEPFLKAS